MRVLYDGIIYSRQVTGGINRYFSRIIERLPSSVKPILTYRDQRGITFPHRDGLALQSMADVQTYADMQYDLLHPTYYHLLTDEDMRKVRGPIVLTVHDMLHELYPALADPDGEQQEMKRKTIPYADALICVSENTKRDVLRLVQVPEDRITVIHHAAELNLTQADHSTPLPQGPYFLYVGHRYCYKNVPRLLEVFKVLLEHRDAFLCFAGTPFSDDEKRRIHTLGLEKRIINVGYVPDEQLARLYEKALALVYPSLYEGFGIPLLEAMQCDCPVLASNTSSIPEVVGDAALLFPPESNDAMLQAMQKIYDDSSIRHSLIEKGRVRANAFSWEEAAIRTVEVYEKVTGIQVNT